MFDKWLDRARRKGATYADVRLQHIQANAIELRNGQIERVTEGQESGLGVRVLANGAWGFASVNDDTAAAMERALDRSLRLAKSVAARTKDPGGVSAEKAHRASALWKPKVAPADVDPAEKEEVIRRMHDAVKDVPEIKATTGSYGDRTIDQEFYSSDGARVKTSITRSVAQLHFVAKKGSRITSRRIRVGAAKGFELFRETDVAAKSLAGAQAAVRLLSAPAPPSGRMPVVLDPELTGVFAHEALGHASEGDLVAAGESLLRERIGESLGSSLVTLVDDSTVQGSFGSFAYDDEGQPGRRRVLMQKGRLVGFLNDRLSAHRLGQQSSASSRAESYAATPIVRMSNTFIEPGDHSFEELLEPIKDGVYAVGSRGGQVDTAKGSFAFNAQEAYRIRNGELAEPLRDVSLTGATLETLAGIDALGNEFHWGDPGYCGKGQYVPVGDGGPHTRIKSCLVGGGS